VKARLLVRSLPWALVLACGGPAHAPEVAPSASAEPAAEASSAVPAASSSAPPPVPTGGVVLVGDINAPKGFDPKPVIEGFKPQLVDCYDKARATHPDLRGKVTLQIQINEAGAVLGVDAAPGGHANDPALVACIADAMKAGARFPKPKGTAIVNAPLVFHP
jgi:hypothetical protein